jgi:hypothetical protein
MGCACSSGIDPNDLTSNSDLYHPQSRGGPLVKSPERPVNLAATQPSSEKRRLQAEAAERRAQEHARRGLGPSKISTESAIRQELIGKIAAQYQMRNQVEPLGLALASIDQLKDHYTRLTKLICFVSNQSKPA